MQDKPKPDFYYTCVADSASSGKKIIDDSCQYDDLTNIGSAPVSLIDGNYEIPKNTRYVDLTNNGAHISKIAEQSEKSYMTVHDVYNRSTMHLLYEKR